nr:hypothetical protein Iba_chr01dCG10600 [Ipomoea batatas]
MTSSWAPLRLRTAAATTHSSSSLLIPNSQRLRHLRFSGTTDRPSSSHLALQVGASYLRDGRRPGMLRSRLRQLLGRWLIYTLEARLVEVLRMAQSTKKTTGPRWTLIQNDAVLILKEAPNRCRFTQRLKVITVQGKNRRTGGEMEMEG